MSYPYHVGPPWTYRYLWIHWSTDHFASFPIVTSNGQAWRQFLLILWRFVFSFLNHFLCHNLAISILGLLIFWQYSHLLMSHSTSEQAGLSWRFADPWFNSTTDTDANTHARHARRPGSTWKQWPASSTVMYSEGCLHRPHICRPPHYRHRLLALGLSTRLCGRVSPLHRLFQSRRTIPLNSIYYIYPDAFAPQWR